MPDCMHISTANIHQSVNTSANSPTLSHLFNRRIGFTPSEPSTSSRWTPLQPMRVSPRWILGVGWWRWTLKSEVLDLSPRAKAFTWLSRIWVLACLFWQFEYSTRNVQALYRTLLFSLRYAKESKNYLSILSCMEKIAPFFFLIYLFFSSRRWQEQNPHPWLSPEETAFQMLRR